MERPEFDKLLTATLTRLEGAAKSYAVQFDRPQEWQDILQTSLLRMLTYAHLYDPDKGEFMPWACVVIINTIKTRILQAANLPPIQIIDNRIAETIPHYRTPSSDLRTSMILSNLNEESRLYVEGYNYVEIAARQGFNSKVTAMNRIDSCAARLSRVLGMKAYRGRRVRNCAKATIISPDS